jgi:hypothetical protein
MIDNREKVNVYNLANISILKLILLLLLKMLSDRFSLALTVACPSQPSVRYTATRCRLIEFGIAYVSIR